MIKIETGKGKTLTFDIDIQGGDSNEIKETRFILSCPNKSYRLVFPAIIENNSVSVDLPPLDIQEKIGSCSLEMISSDNQYYQIWTDDVKFDRGLKIVVKEQKSEERKVIVESKNQETTEVKNIPVKKEIKNILNESNKKREFVRLYRTIKADNKSISKVFSENFEMMSKPGLKVQFYRNDTQLINDMETVDHGICVGMNVPTDSIIHEDKGVVIVDSTNLGKIDKKNILFIIKEGRMINVTQSEY
jgi:energy-converting hydrogenase A subunit M